MRYRQRATLVALIIATLTAGARAQDACSLAASSNLQPGNLYLVSSGNGQPAFHSYDLKPISVTGADQILQFAYIVPDGGVSPRTGILVVKLTQKDRNFSQRPLPSTIHLVRKTFPYVCGFRDVGDLSAWWTGFILPIEDDVDIREYIYYHKTRSDFGASRLYAFHINYKDRDGVCVATDDKSNGNRQQFLFEDRASDNSLVASNFRRGLAGGAEAVAGTLGEAGEVVGKVAEAVAGEDRLEAIAKTYQAYGQLETQMYSYAIPNSPCVSFSVQHVSPGQTLKVTLNDLEQRQRDGKRPSATARMDKSWTFYIRQDVSR
ncbi:MAG TPA: hypothetical protein VMR17_03760 [Xanthobacteraceae bacterium]|jgi:hypothetical protein|nr:hypothetical protein [Xanthobacteraceae bacterium]